MRWSLPTVCAVPFPQPIWGPRRRDPSAARLANCRRQLAALTASIVELLPAD